MTAAGGARQETNKGARHQAHPVDPVHQDRRRRNRCAIGAASIYGIVNLVGLTLLRDPKRFAYEHADAIFGTLVFLGFAMIGLYAAFCCFGARVRGWSGWIGVPIALAGIVFWIGTAIGLLYQNINSGFSIANQPRVYDDRLPALLIVAFVVSAFAIRALPNRVVLSPAEAAR